MEEQTDTPHCKNFALKLNIMKMNTLCRSALMTGRYPYLLGQQGNPGLNWMNTGLTLDRYKNYFLSKQGRVYMHK